jgi:hypothetical protein
MPDFADLSLTEIVDAVASRDPTPGAGPSLAWTCALAAGLVEMVSAVMLGKEPELPSNSRIASSDVLIPAWLRLDQAFKGGRAAVLFGGDHRPAERLRISPGGPRGMRTRACSPGAHA